MLKYQLIPEVVMSENKRIESEEDVSTFLARLKYGIDSNCSIRMQVDRHSEKLRPVAYSNRYTLANLFPNEDSVKVMKRELRTLTCSEYIETVVDLKYPEKPELRVFGRYYDKQGVYIKLRVHLVNPDTYIFVMSFHYALHQFEVIDFPYKKGGVVNEI
jgi:hypothetical protein